MKDDSQATTSIWMAMANTPSQSPLKESIRTDICIIGAGIAGLMTHSAQAGNVHRLSAVCPHLGCVVAWNSTEKT